MNNNDIKQICLSIYLIKNEMYNMTLLNKICMNYKLFFNDKLFNFYNLNNHNKNENLINIIIINLYRCNYKLNILFKFCCL